uniref:Uncharacterized protein n=1 Tax=Rhizophora mucronata TaxID=61149 RepID=A0A2P2QUC1_RHIMU
MPFHAKTPPSICVCINGFILNHNLIEWDFVNLRIFTTLEFSILIVKQGRQKAFSFSLISRIEV